MSTFLLCIVIFMIFIKRFWFGNNFKKVINAFLLISLIFSMTTSFADAPSYDADSNLSFSNESLYKLEKNDYLEQIGTEVVITDK